MSKEEEEELVLLNVGLVLSQLRTFGYLRGVADIDDLKQAGYIALLKAIRNYNPNLGTQLGSYCFQAIKHALIKEAKHFPMDKEPLMPDKIDEALMVFDATSLWEFLPDNLSELEKDIIILRTQGYSLGEIGRELGYSKEWINQVLKGGMEKIKKANE